MGLPLPLTLMFSMGAGMGTSYGLNRVMFSDINIKVESNNNLLDDNGEFIDDNLENNYQKYVKKGQKGQTPKDRLSWKAASDYWTQESPVARGNKINGIKFKDKVCFTGN